MLYRTRAIQSVLLLCNFGNSSMHSGGDSKNRGSLGWLDDLERCPGRQPCLRSSSPGQFSQSHAGTCVVCQVCAKVKRDHSQIIFRCEHRRTTRWLNGWNVKVVGVPVWKHEVGEKCLLSFQVCFWKTSWVRGEFIIALLEIRGEVRQKAWFFRSLSFMSFLKYKCTWIEFPGNTPTRCLTFSEASRHLHSLSVYRAQWPWLWSQYS